MLELTEDAKEALNFIIEYGTCQCRRNEACVSCPLFSFNCGETYGEEVEKARELLAMIDKQKDGEQC